MSSAFKLEYERLIADHRIQFEEGQEPVVQALDHLASEISTKMTLRDVISRRGSSVRKGAYIWGKVGRGKSMLMNLFFEQAEEPSKRRLHFHAFMQHVHSIMQPAGEGRHEDPIGRAATEIFGEGHLLCLDELEVTDIADAMIVGRLFDRLFELGLVLVATSNNHPDDLYANGPNRELFVPFIDRLKQHVEVVQLGGSHDHRGDKDPAEATYLSPVTEANRRHFDDLWRKTLNHEVEAPSTVSVHGHILQFKCSHGRSVRVTFEEVCRQPLSADDHLAMAARFNLVFLEGLPVIPQDNAEEGRRFVTLIDALYEAKVRLTVLAAASPEQIFEQVRSEDQRRTVSRLNEMRSRPAV